jgi:fumarylacetoacetase
MTISVNATHDPSRRSWVESANHPAADFPIQNLPFGIFRRTGDAEDALRSGVAIGDEILDIQAALEAGLFEDAARDAAGVAATGSLNRLMAKGNTAASAIRASLSDALAVDAPARVRELVSGLLLPSRDVSMQLPAAIGGFTDFFTSIFHATRAGRISRPDRPLPPAFKHMPMAYNSRASTVRPSGESVRRPHGHTRIADTDSAFGPCGALDFELEIGMFVGPGNQVGEPVHIEHAADHIFGFCLLNDWSARDLQRSEMFPLGPFLSKSAFTTISPWVVTAEAMAPFRVPAFARAEDDTPAGYLLSAADQATGGYNIALYADIVTSAMREAAQTPARLTATNFRDNYWTFAQMLTHHTSAGCSLRPGDLLASGTVSGPDDSARACLFELSLDAQAGVQRPIQLPNGEQRLWLEDGDEIVLTGRAEQPGFVSIGFGECRGKIAPAYAWASH